jgi:hypothetical protein
MAYRIVENPPATRKPAVGGGRVRAGGNRVAHRPVGRYRHRPPPRRAGPPGHPAGGESLINDASGLVAYRLVVSAVVAGSFSPCGLRVRHVPGAVRSLRAAPDRFEQVAPQPSEDGWIRSGTPGTLRRSVSDQVQLSAL